MMQLPWKDLRVVDASSGLEIYDNDLMLKVDFLPATTTITGPFDGGFMDRVYELGSEIIIEGWATWSESEPSIGLRGARESRSHYGRQFSTSRCRTARCPWIPNCPSKLNRNLDTHMSLN